MDKSNARRVAITRKVDLSPYADGWDDCYAVVVLASYQQKRDLQEKNDVEKMSDADATAFMLKVAEENFISGKIRVLGANNESQLVDMEPDDIECSVSVISAVYLTIMGVSLDPKAIQTALETSSTSTATSDPSPSESVTKTTSSTESQPTTSQ